MLSQEITTTWSDLGLVALSAMGMLLGVIVCVRIVGLRSLSKMSSFDFAVTVAMGSLLAAVSLSNSSLIEGVTAVIVLLGLQALIAFGRRRSDISELVDNRPLMLMTGRTMLEDNMRSARVTADDLRAKLREANVVNYDQVHCVVLETTGDVSVIHGDGDLEADLVSDVIGDV